MIQFIPADFFATAGLGFGVDVCATTTAVGGFFASGFGVTGCAETALALDAGAGCLAVSFLGAVALGAFTKGRFGFALGRAFFAAAAFGSSFLSLSSNAGFGIE
jgi:hypothetical protein